MNHFIIEPSRRKEQKRQRKQKLQDTRRRDSKHFEEKTTQKIKVRFVNRGLGKMVNAQNFWVSINHLMTCEEIVQRIEIAFNLDLQEMNRR